MHPQARDENAMLRRTLPRYALLACVAAASLLIDPTQARQEKQLLPTRDRLADLVEQLGDENFEKREAAAKTLEGLGEAALTPLRKGALSKDAEVRRRSAVLYQSVFDQLARVLEAKTFARLAGKWEIRYAQPMVSRDYLIDKEGNVTWSGNVIGKLVLRDGTFSLLNARVMQFERVTLGEDGRLFFEHWPNFRDFPNGPFTHGIATRVE